MINGSRVIGHKPFDRKKIQIYVELNLIKLAVQEQGDRCELEMTECRLSIERIANTQYPTKKMLSGS